MILRNLISTIFDKYGDSLRALRYNSTLKTLKFSVKKIAFSSIHPYAKSYTTICISALGKHSELCCVSSNPRLSPRFLVVQNIFGSEFRLLIKETEISHFA